MLLHCSNYTMPVDESTIVHNYFFAADSTRDPRSPGLAGKSWFWRRRPGVPTKSCRDAKFPGFCLTLCLKINLIYNECPRFFITSSSSSFLSSRVGGNETPIQSVVSLFNCSCVIKSCPVVDIVSPSSWWSAPTSFSVQFSF